jgi:hypothetical protein
MECCAGRLIHPRSRFTSGKSVSGFSRLGCVESLPLVLVSGVFHLCFQSCAPTVILFAGQLFVSGMLLLYTAIVAPAQVFLWEFNEEECNVFPTLYFDIFVDVFFIV